MAIGFTLPFAQSSGSVGYFQTTQDELSATRENLKSLLLTNWGERPMRYRFGCNLAEFNFRQESQNVKQLIADRITEQVTAWLPFLTIIELNVLFSEDDSNLPSNAIGIKIKFALNRRPDLTASVDAIAGGGGWTIEEN